MKQEEKHLVDIRNKKASFEYFLTQEFTAGIVLYGSEIKSIRSGKASLTDAFCTFLNGELWIHDMHIAEYRFSSYGKFDAKRERKLLMNRSELNKLEARYKEKGWAIIPTLLYVDERGWAKIKIALARGKHSYDKRESIKDRDTKRELARFIR